MPTPVTPAIVDTVLGHLAQHFLDAANGDLPTARHAASRMLAAHDPQTEEELHLAIDIVSFGFHALEALSAAAAPDLSLNQKLRLRGNAVSLSRQGHKARRALDQLKRVRVAEPAQPRAETGPPNDQQPPAHLIDAASQAAQAAAKPDTFKSLMMSRKQRRAAERAAETLRRNAEQARRLSLAAAVEIPAHTQNQSAHA